MCIRDRKTLVEVEKMASLGRLVSGVAHEINTPVGICITALSHADIEIGMLRKHFDQDVLGRNELDEYLKTQIESNQMIKDNLNRTANLVRSFKSVAVDESSSVPIDFCMKEVINLVADKYREKPYSIKINLQCDETLVITSYPDAFSQIIDNMLLNSFQHGFENTDNGLAKIEVNMMGSLLCMDYSDNGKGMKDEVVKNIFEPFYTTKRKFGGTGLGMHIVYNLVTHKLKGDIVCESEEGKGIRIIMKIPNA